MGSHQPIRKVVAPEIPDKLYFRIGDVAKLCGVEAYVLRFWETEFPQLKPNKGGTGQRLYRRKDVELALRIKSLLRDQGYTIAGARQIFKAETVGKPADVATPQPVALARTTAPVEEGSATSLSMRQQMQLQALRADMAALLAELSRPAAGGGRAVRTADTKPAVATMRPRLVLEPRPAMLQKDPTEGGRLRLTQRDLFGVGAAANREDEPAAWPGPPPAS